MSIILHCWHVLSNEENLMNIKTAGNGLLRVSVISFFLALVLAVVSSFVGFKNTKEIMFEYPAPFVLMIQWGICVLLFWLSFSTDKGLVYATKWREAEKNREEYKKLMGEVLTEFKVHESIFPRLSRLAEAFVGARVVYNNFVSGKGFSRDESMSNNDYFASYDSMRKTLEKDRDQKLNYFYYCWNLSKSLGAMLGYQQPQEFLLEVERALGSREPKQDVQKSGCITDCGSVAGGVQME